MQSPFDDTILRSCYFMWRDCRGEYSIDRRFSRAAPVRYYQHIYNGGRLPLAVQAKVFRGNQLVHQSPQDVLSQSA